MMWGCFTLLKVCSLDSILLPRTCLLPSYDMLIHTVACLGTLIHVIVYLICCQQMLISKYWEHPWSAVAQNTGGDSHTQLIYNSLEFRHYYGSKGKTTYFDYFILSFYNST